MPTFITKSSAGRRTGPLILASIMISACGCVFGTAEAGKMASDTVSTEAQAARVADAWQSRFLQRLESEAAATEAWGLFSEGGWSDAGQVMILSGAKLKHLLVVKANRDEYAIDRPLTADEYAKLEPLLKEATTLQDVDIASFDGLVFELVHATKGPDGKAVVKDRLFIRNPNVEKAPRHEAIIDALQKLRKT